MIDSQTKLYCIVGHPVAQSLSPIMHNAAYEKLGLNCVFLAFDITDVGRFINAMGVLNIKGVSVTIPYKLEVMKYLDKIDAVAKEIGAVNTIVNDDGKLTGYNTDWIGAVKALEEKVNLKGRKVIIIGRGGAAKAISYGLQKEKAQITVIGRERGKSELNALKHADIIINATPVGMTPNDNESPIPRNVISKYQTIFDIIFKPHETRLLKDALENGATVIYGYKMLLFGASLQFKLFTGYDAPINVMEKSVINFLNHKS